MNVKAGEIPFRYYKGDIIRRKPEDKSNGFDHGLTAVKILEADPGDGESGILYLVKWKEVTSLEIIGREIANEKIPQLVIEFLQSRLVFKSKCSYY
ncbi:chromobox protein 1-like protein [Leptotrombidium deliense]|uniref:Chromobox protein 1-like protein n=1 Tax=Leptotrombidium deliense TaxID=299467 RepID=A0A443SKX9_9ACAR|nr:chromobox protein 1-like protein [Leptotrombidium deliense]